MQRKTLQPYFLLAALAGSLVLAFYILQPFLAPLILAAIFAVVLRPIYESLCRRLGGRQSISALLTALLFTIIILVPAFTIGSQLVQEAQQLYESLSQGGASGELSTLLSSLGSMVSGIVPGAEARLLEASTHIDEYAQSALNWALAHVGPVFSGLLNLALDIFIFFVSLYYFLRDGGQLAAKLVEFSPLPDTDDSRILVRLEAAVNSVIKGQLTIALVQGFLTGIGLWLFGVPSPALWGVVASIAALVPSIGTALVIAPAVFYLAIVGSVPAAIGLAIYGAVAVGLIDNLLGPRLISSGLKLHPLIVILAIIGGLVFFGPIGVFLGPLTMSLLIVLLSIYGDLTNRSDSDTAAVGR